MSVQARAASRLSTLYPAPGPWTSAALWFGRATLAPPASALRDELDAIHQHRLAGALLRYAREHEVVLDRADRTFLQRSSLRWMALTTAAGTHARVALDRLDAAGVHAVVPKGPGIARWYPAPDCRPYSDIDLLVPAARFSDAVAVLESDGWHEAERNLQPRSFMRRRCREGLNLQSNDGGSIDVHHRVPPWIWSSGLDVGGRSEQVQGFPCLDATGNALVAGLHIVSDNNAPGQSLRVWRDLVEAVHHAPSDDLAAAAGRAGLGGWLRCVLRAVPEFCAVDAVDAVVAALPDQPLPHPARLDALLSGRLERLGVFASQCLRLPVPNAIACAAGMAVPSRNFLRVKFSGQAHPYRAWLHLAADRIERPDDGSLAS